MFFAAQMNYQINCYHRNNDILINNQISDKLNGVCMFEYEIRPLE